MTASQDFELWESIHNPSRYPHGAPAGFHGPWLLAPGHPDFCGPVRRSKTWIENRARTAHAEALSVV